MGSRLNRTLVFKFGVTVAALAVLAGIAGSQLAPSVPLHVILFYSAIGAIALFVAVMVAVVLTLTLIQFLLRKGGTDPQWFWFNAEPPGLVQLREQIAAKKSEKLR